MTSIFSTINKSNFGSELLAGITLIAISVPLNIGYAQIAGLPATAGLYALVVPTLIWAFTTTSRQVVAAPDAAAAALVASSLTGLAVAGGENYLAMAAAQAILGGLIFILLAVFKLGFLASFLSKPILVGFVGGLAVEIMLRQIHKMLGIHAEAEGIFAEVWETVLEIPEANLWAVAISLGSLAILLIGRRLSKGFPWALLVLVVATVATVVWNLADRGVSVLGEVPAGFPTLSWPRIELSAWLALIPSALALTMVTVAEGLLVIRAYAEKNGYTTDPDKDLAAFGYGNIAAGVSGSFTIGSSASRSAAMDQAGSRTQLPSVVLAAGSLLLLLFGTALLADIPSPAIGAIVAVAVFRLLGFGELNEIRKLSRFEFAVGLACMLGVLVLGPIQGVLVAFVLSLINLARRAAHPPVDVLQGHDDPQVSLLATTSRGETAPGVIVMRFSAPIFFANSGALGDHIRRLVAEAPNPVKALVIDLEAATDIDVTGAESLERSLEWLHQQGIATAYTRLRPELRQLLEHFGLTAHTSEFATNREAVAALR